MRMPKVVAVLCLLIASSNLNTTPAEFEVGWVGENGYTLSGSFSIDTSLLSTGVIFQDSLLSFSMAGFLNGELLGMFSGIPESFLFDTTNIVLLVGTGNIQVWNFSGPGINFLSANFSQAMGLDGSLIRDSVFRVATGLTQEDSRLTVMRVPEPATRALFTLGLIGFVFGRRQVS